MADGFLGRWSKRKLDLKDGKPVEPEPALAQPAPPTTPAGGSVNLTALAPLPQRAEDGSEGGAAPRPAAEPEPLPLPTLEDVAALTPESDYARFAARDVAPEVRNAAMKKLFTDPHYNVMDRLDIYIDDYSQPDPIPPEMLRQMVSAKFLGLFDEEEKKEAQRDEAEKKENAQAEPEVISPSSAREDADNPTPGTVAQSDSTPALAVPAPPAHADPDLRLQPNDAPPGQDPGGRA